MFKKSLKKIAIGSLSLIFSLFMVSGACASEYGDYEQVRAPVSRLSRDKKWKDRRHCTKYLEEKLNFEDLEQKRNFVEIYNLLAPKGVVSKLKNIRDAFTIEDYKEVVDFMFEYREDFAPIDSLFDESMRFSVDNIYDISFLLKELSELNDLDVKVIMPLQFEDYEQKRRFCELYNEMVFDWGNGASKDTSRNFFEDELDKVEDFKESKAELDIFTNADYMIELDMLKEKLQNNLITPLEFETEVEKARLSLLLSEDEATTEYRAVCVFLNSILKYNGLPTFYPGISEYQPE